MEDTLREKDTYVKYARILVLILILMEDTLRDILKSTPKGIVVMS